MTLPEIIAKRWRLVELASLWRSELKTNRRAAAGLLIIILLVAGYGLFVLRDATTAKRVAYDRQLVLLQRIAAIAQQRDWPQRADASAAVRAALENRLWVAESDGVARADIQDWVTGIARDIGLPALDVRIELAAPKSLPPDLRQITTTITAQPSEAALIALLERIDRAPHLVVVDRLNVKQQPGPFLEMVLIGYARIGAKDITKVNTKASATDRSEPE
jgi:hypothetical protein